MVRATSYLKFIVVMLLIISCGINTKTLEDGTTKVPKDSLYFNKGYRQKFNVINVKNVRYNSIYIEKYYVNPYTKKRFDLRIGYNSFIGAIKFYENGTLNLFSVDKHKLKNLPLFNPKKMGYRGISYIKNKDTLVDIIEPITDAYRMGKRTYQIEIKGDSLTLVNKKNNDMYIYKERKLLKKNTSYKSNWQP